MSLHDETGKLEVCVDLDGNLQRFGFDRGPIVIGRHPDCEVVIGDSRVSRHHATIAEDDGRWILRDSGSVNGVELDGRRVACHTLTGDDLLLIGGVPVTFTILASPLGDDASTKGIEYAESIAVGDFDHLLEHTMIAAPRPDTRRAGPDRTLDPVQIIAILKRATEALLTHDGLDPLLETLLDLIFDHLPADRAHVLMLDPATGELRPKAQRITEDLPEVRLQISRRIADEAIRSKQAVLVVDAREDERFDGSDSVYSLGIRSAMCVPLCDHDRVVGLIFVDRRSRNAFTRSHLEMLSILAGISAAAVERARLQDGILRERAIRARLSRYHAPAVVDRIVMATESETDEMAAEEREVTVLFADIAGFTRMSEHLPAREVTALLNEVFEALTEEVFEENGTLDKFIGDAVMVFFGAPLPQPDHAARAVRVALAMQRRVARLNAELHPREPIAVRIGINSGKVVVGDVGARQRRDYTVIGDTVNTASRLESSVAEPGQIVIGDRCFERLEGQFDCRPLESAVLRGKTMTVHPCLVVGPADRRTGS